MKLHAIVCATALGLGLGAVADATAQENSGIVGEKGVVGEKGSVEEERQAGGTDSSTTPLQSVTSKRAATSASSARDVVSPSAQGQRIDAASKARLREGAVIAPNRGLVPRPSVVGPVGPGATGQRSDNQNGGGKGPPNEPPNQNMGRLTGDAGWAGQSDEKLPHKEPKGPDKMPAALSNVDRLGGNVGLAGKSEEKAPPKEPEPKDPKGPDKLGNTTLEAQTTEAAATRASPAAVQRAARGAVQGRP